MNKTTSIILTSVVVAGIAGYFLGYSFGGKAVASTYSDRIAIANMMTPARVDVRFVNGRIKEIKGSTITVDRVLLSQNPFAGDAPVSREVTITNATKLTKILPKDMAVYNAELAMVQKRLKEDPKLLNGPITTPSLFVETPIKASDLKAGDTVVVSAATDILQAPSFSATQIQVTMPNPLSLK